MSNSQQHLRVAAEDHFPLFFGDPHGLQTFQHFRNTPDLVWVVAAGKDLAGAGEAYGQLERAWIEVNGVIEKLFEIRTGRARDVGAAVSKGLIAAIETL